MSLRNDQFFIYPLAPSLLPYGRKMFVYTILFGYGFRCTSPSFISGLVGLSCTRDCQMGSSPSHLLGHFLCRFALLGILTRAYSIAIRFFTPAMGSLGSVPVQFGPSMPFGAFRKPFGRLVALIRRSVGKVNYRPSIYASFRRMRSLKNRHDFSEIVSHVDFESNCIFPFGVCGGGTI